MWEKESNLNGKMLQKNEKSFINRTINFEKIKRKFIKYKTKVDKYLKNRIYKIWIGWARNAWNMYV